MTYLAQVGYALEQIRALGRYRALEAAAPHAVADFSSNDYLALAADPRVVQALQRATRVGSGGARLLGGRHRDHAALEEELARHLGRERALLFSSGYLAAHGAVGVLARFARVVYSDRLNHACLIDAVRASGLPREIYPHGALPPKSARSAAALVVTESIFSMDGDCADVGAILAQLGDDDVLLVDEAHALGVAGPQGAGLAYGLNDPRVVVMGTLSKALGAAGGFVAGPAPLIELLVNAARTFIFDTALPPAVALAARVALMLSRSEPERRIRLHAAAAHLRAGLQALGLPAHAWETPIIPVVLGEERRAMAVCEAALARGVYAPAVRPPTVPPGSSRLRISLRADHTIEQVDLLLEALKCTATS